MFALIFSIGILVDDAIVVVEKYPSGTINYAGQTQSTPQFPAPMKSAIQQFSQH
ncbi:MAG: hypothetical protein IPP40_05000 [bacterium]|nr:hypothetical protein [bacterium]